MDLQARHPSRYGIRSAFLPIQLVDDALLIEFPDEAHIDESLRVGGLGARVAGVPTERGTCHCVVFPTPSTLLVIRRGWNVTSCVQPESQQSCDRVERLC